MSFDGPVLALDSATATGSVAVGNGGALIAEVVLGVAGAHSAALLPAADQALRMAGLRPSDLRAVVVGAGPGSFTGIRIAAASAKGMVQGLGVPLLAYSSLLAAAVAGWGADGEVCALFDARRRDVYAAAYRLGNGGAGEGVVDTLLPPSALSLDRVIERYRGGRAPLFVGDAATRHAAELERELGARVLPPQLGIPRASALLWLAERAPEWGRVEDAAAWEPEYVRASGAERMAARGGGAEAPAP